MILSNNAKVKSVFYPGLAHHPSHEIAKKQQSGFGGMLSFELKEGLTGVKKFIEKIELLPFLDLFSKNKKINFEISNLNSMIKNRNLSQFKVIKLQAKLSYQGSVMPKIGDLFSEEVLVKNTTETVNLSLSKVNSKDNN